MGTDPDIQELVFLNFGISFLDLRGKSQGEVAGVRLYAQHTALCIEDGPAALSAKARGRSFKEFHGKLLDFRFAANKISRKNSVDREAWDRKDGAVEVESIFLFIE